MVVFHCKSMFKVFIIFVGTTDEETTAAPSTAAPSTEASTTTGPPAGGMRIFLAAGIDVNVKLLEICITHKMKRLFSL